LFFATTYGWGAVVQRSLTCLLPTYLEVARPPYVCIKHSDDMYFPCIYHTPRYIQPIVSLKALFTFYSWLYSLVLHVCNYETPRTYLRLARDHIIPCSPYAFFVSPINYTLVSFDPVPKFPYQPYAMHLCSVKCVQR